MQSILRKKFFDHGNFFKPISRYATVADDPIENRALMTHEYKREIRKFPPSVYGGIHILTCVYSTGLGLKLFNAVRRIVDHSGAPVFWESFALPQSKIKHHYIEEITQSILRNRIAVKSNFELGRKNFGEGSMSYANNYIINSLDLFAGILKFRTFEGLKTKHKNVDMAVVFQNNWGDFHNLEYEPVKGVVESIRVAHGPLFEKLVVYACNYAMRRGRKKISIVHHKIHISIEQSEQLFLETAKKVQSRFPELEFEQMNLRETIGIIFKDPSYFDVICLTDRFASPVASALCGICGGQGLFSGASYNEYIAMFEPAEVKLCLRDNRLLKGPSPIAVLTSTIGALNYVGLGQYADKIEKALYKTILSDKIRTLDLGGRASATQVCDQIMRNLDEIDYCEAKEIPEGGKIREKKESPLF